MNVELDLRRVVPLVLRATGNDYYIRHTDEIVRHVAGGYPLYQAFAASRAFPSDFIDALQVAEESGRIVESFEKLSKRYEEEAKTGINALVAVLVIAIWILVFGVIIWMIFRLFGFYLNTLNDALKM